MGIVEWGLFGLFVSGWFIGAGAWLILVVESIRAVLCLTPDARRHRYVRWNWFNALPRRELFNEAGLRHRDRAFRALLWFIGALAVGGAAGLVTLAIRRYGS
jgi:hypothetical protein